ncbi:hypothetical protein [Bradyrhizobium liaoningense]|uniref:hypothetical protein n=1 Tax=Bradyrhizobium liaoningense TaxID=43992 RepID=UPI001BACBBA5|nr:hypothetical protein [Bradyrhizobium liaoningense]MBR0903576.1 hypothetical protein [Bradyrhizobium liaoningense]
MRDGKEVGHLTAHSKPAFVVDVAVIVARDLRAMSVAAAKLAKLRAGAEPAQTGTGFASKIPPMWLAAESRNRSFAAILYNYM